MCRRELRAAELALDPQASGGPRRVVALALALTAAMALSLGAYRLMATGAGAVQAAPAPVSGLR